MMDLNSMPFVDSNLNGGGLRPATGTGQPESENTAPESNLALQEPFRTLAWLQDSQKGGAA